MPIYSTLRSIEEVMTDKDIIAWKVMNADEEMLHHMQPGVAVKAKDSFNTLKKFLDELTGDGAVLIYLYDRKYKSGGGGALSQWVYKHWYHLSPGKDSSPVNAHGIDSNYMALVERINGLTTQITVDAKQREIDGLKEELKAAKKNDKSYFESVAETIGKSWAKEYLKTNGYEVTPDGAITENSSPAKSKVAQPAPDKKEVDTRELAKRGSDAIVSIMKVAGDQASVIEGLESMSKLAQTDPVKLATILKDLQE